MYPRMVSSGTWSCRHGVVLCGVAWFLGGWLSAGEGEGEGGAAAGSGRVGAQLTAVRLSQTAGNGQAHP